MGRYDRIRVFDGTNWRQPRKIYVYNGSNWVDLKADDDTSQSGTLHIFDALWKDATKHYVSTSHTEYGPWYTTGEFTITDSYKYCYCPSSSVSSMNRKWDFWCTIRKTDNNTHKRILYIGSSNENTKIKITWLASGYIQVETRSSFDGSDVKTMQSNNAVFASTDFVSLRVYQNKDDRTMHIIFNGQETTQTMAHPFTITNTIGKAGTDGINFKDTFHLEGGSPTSGGGYGEGTINQNATTLTSNTSRDSWIVTTGQWE